MPRYRHCLKSCLSHAWPSSPHSMQHAINLVSRFAILCVAASRQASKPASKPPTKQASKLATERATSQRASKQESKQTSKQASEQTDCWLLLGGVHVACTSPAAAESPPPLPNQTSFCYARCVARSFKSPDVTRSLLNQSNNQPSNQHKKTGRYLFWDFLSFFFWSPGPLLL